MSTPAPRSAAYFDDWYANMARQPTKDEVMQRHLGLPPHLLSTSLLPWGGIEDVVTALRLAPGDVLLDLGCGRGGYGLEVARRTGAGLIGVDFSAEALRQAAESARHGERTMAEDPGPDGDPDRVAPVDADFRLGDLTATGLDAGSVQAVMCIDAIQFATPQEAGYRELRRVLVPGGRVVLTSWQARDRGDERVSERIREVDLRGGLTGAGFHEVEVCERADWRALEHGLWQEVVALDPGDDPALRSLYDEGVRSLAHFDSLIRVLATAVAP